ncbi:MAG: hypothetical protein P8N31_03465 [Planctomycetota bacterium]|nr:hypothetical protein [Planctomycetota bacterium]MDG2142591.1 hypothetical protein [Planctomycetota bacterium]
MHPISSLRVLAGGIALCFVAFTPNTDSAPASAPVASGKDGVLLVPHMLTAARNLVPVDGQVLVYNPGNPKVDADRVELLELRVALDGIVVESRALDVDLLGDSRFGELAARVERLPHSVTEMGRDRVFAPLDAPEFTGAEVTANMRSIRASLAELRSDWDDGLEQPVLAIDFRYELDQLFFPADPAGTERIVAIEVDYRDSAGTLQTAATTAAVTRLKPALVAPATLDRTRGGAIAATTTHIHGGDLHVHSCHGEAAGACAPFGNCGAESFQLSGSFTYAQLKSQYTALGLDWYTATDHSYCMDSANEYNTIAAECSALTDSSFLVIPDTELSSDESGAQSGSDLGDAICLGGTTSNHMGAHGISTWKHGGSQEFWGFCDGPFTDELEGYAGNINKIRNEGGYPIVNHPTGSSFGWNSVAGLRGIENNDMHGVEIWNGASVTGQGGDVGAWINWLEDGRILYGYSGSDTHDEAFAFGANQVVLRPTEPFAPGTVQKAIREGRVFLSRDHVLVHEALITGDALEMGSLQTLSPAQQSTVVTLEAHYNFGGDTGTVTFFTGSDGVQEAVHASSGPLTGQGVFTSTYIPALGKNSWSRAYAIAGSAASYSNPIFYLPGTSFSTEFGNGLGGANIGGLSSDAAPAIGATIDLDITGFTGANSAILGASVHQIPGGLAVAGGNLLINLPLAYQTTVPIDGAGNGTHRLRMPFVQSIVGITVYWQAVGPTGALPGGLAFTNGLAMPISAMGQ